MTTKTRNQINTVKSTLYSNGRSAVELHEVLRVVVLPALAVESPHFVEELCDKYLIQFPLQKI